jgi:mRNA-degrading endonuclease toxin of MazEF toxin-antitoxin module
MSSLSVAKGDVVPVDVPYLDATQSVRRPALVISDSSQMLDVIIAGITSRVRVPLPSTHYVVDRNHPDWNGSGLRMASAIRCNRLFTVEHGSLHRVLGRLSQATLLAIDECLKRALQIA